MNIFILTEGGDKVGFGHLIRSVSLYQAFLEQGQTPTIIVNGDRYAENILKGKNYQIFNWLKENKRLFKLIKDADIISIDSYLADKSIYIKLSELFPNGILAMIDDYKRIDYPKGVVINHAIYGDKLNYPQRDGVVYLLGRDFIILQKEFWPDHQKPINREVGDILVTFGGMNHSKLIGKIIDYAKKRFDFNLQVIEPRKGIVETKDMLKAMLKADICISGGGQTTYQLARVGVPTIGICFADNQRLNLEGWQGAGFIEYIGSSNDEDLLENMAGAIKKLMPYEERVRRSQAGRNYVDGKGAERIVNRLIDRSANSENEKYFVNNGLSIKLRDAREDDCRDLWIWRNHPLARRGSFSKEIIRYSKHKKWFEKKLRDRAVKIYIAEDMKGEKIGQIRFEKNRKSADINISLNPLAYGKGIGYKVIRMATEKFLDNRPEIKEIIAEIISDNVASKKAFERSGYAFFDNTSRLDKDAEIFKFKR